MLIPNQLKKYDLFLSVPMSFDGDKEYKKFRSQCLELIKLMEEQCGFKNVYFAGRDIESMKQFTPGQNAALLDLQALKQSKRFMMYMPKKMSSSCTFEAGYALRKNMPTVYLCHSSDDLPFLMKNLNDRFSRVNKYEAGDFDQLKYIIEQHGKCFYRKSV